MSFILKSKMKPKGDQPEAIRLLTDGLNSGMRHQTLLGVTGSGKTFTMANVIKNAGKPALVVAHNKTLAAQLCSEFREFFPDAAVEYFVSYYDYYQPEAYIAPSDTYIEKEASINEEIDRLRHAATQALLTRDDVIITASVSCIYGLGAPESYKKMHMHIKAGQDLSRGDVLRHLVRIQYERTSSDLRRGTFRSRGGVIEIMPADREVIYRIDIEGGKIASLLAIDPVTRKVRGKPGEVWVFPARHFITSGPELERAIAAIRKEAKERVGWFIERGKLLEAERLERRTNFDMVMLREVGHCNGIENYSRHLSGRGVGEPPDTLLSYFPDDLLVFIDESHVTVPQIGGMYNGDAARKKSLIDYGFRLPSAADNRPLTFDEFMERVPRVVYVSATPRPYERDVSSQVVEQVIRPTGLVDPKITVAPVTEKGGVPGQIEDLLGRIDRHVEAKERVIVTTLTKKMAEDLTDFLAEKGVRVKYLHSDVATIDRVKILTEFRKGEFDVTVGVNLLREGLDLPEVTLVTILDADKEGFLRSETSLVQTIGRAARNVKGEVVLYADEITGSIERAIQETDRRREKQLAYNREHGITPRTIRKAIKDIMEGIMTREEEIARRVLELDVSPEDKPIEELISEKEAEMKGAAGRLEFELAALLRDEIRLLRQKTRHKNKRPGKKKPPRV